MVVWQEGRRDIWIFDREGQPLRRVTQDEASDIDPRFSADGRTLLFASDRTGVFNIYAVDLESERLYQVTNVLGGAFSPSMRADGQAIVFESYSGDGMDIAYLEVDRSHGEAIPRRWCRRRDWRGRHRRTRLAIRKRIVGRRDAGCNRRVAVGHGRRRAASGRV